MAYYRINEEKNGVEIVFSAKPAEEIRYELKENGFRWGRGYWWAKQTPERLALAEKLTGEKAETITGTKAEKETPKAEKINKYGIKVGDIFHMSWGYDQTNNNFFQVVALVGETSVRVKDVNPKITETKAVCSMAEDRTVEINGEMCAPSAFSVFIKDQEHGDRKLVQVETWTKEKRPYIKVGNHWATLCNHGTMKVYESWYA